ncbi:unnamed protein product, partial [Ectocarpus sp. 13 AM-2016]
SEKPPPPRKESPPPLPPVSVGRLRMHTFILCGNICDPLRFPNSGKVSIVPYI